MKDWPYGVSPSREMFIPLSGNRYFVFESNESNPEGTTYVRVVDEHGGELVYWNCDEWEESPVEVMGAICGAMVGGRFNEPNYYAFAPDCCFPDFIDYEPYCD